jgi:hypothetical protein
MKLILILILMGAMESKWEKNNIDKKGKYSKKERKITVKGKIKHIQSQAKQWKNTQQSLFAENRENQTASISTEASHFIVYFCCS